MIWNKDLAVAVASGVEYFKRMEDCKTTAKFDAAMNQPVDTDNILEIDYIKIRMYLLIVSLLYLFFFSHNLNISIFVLFC